VHCFAKVGFLLAFSGKQPLPQRNDSYLLPFTNATPCARVISMSHCHLRSGGVEELMLSGGSKVFITLETNRDTMKKLSNGIYRIDDRIATKNLVPDRYTVKN